MLVSDKQQYLYLLGDRPYFHSFGVGPYGTGKTHWGGRGWLRWLMLNHSGQLGLWGCKKQDIWDELASPLAREFGEETGVPIDVRGRKWLVPPADDSGPPNTVLPVIYAEGAVAANRFRSHNIVGGVFDEATLLHDEVRKQAIARCRVGDDLKLLWLMNPDSEWHPMKIMIDEKVADGTGEEINIGLADNPGLSAAWVHQLVSTYVATHERMRYVLGRWSTASGLIFRPIVTPVSQGGALRKLTDDIPIFGWHVWIDYASKTVTHALCVAETPHGLWIADEWVHDGEDQGELEADEQVRRMMAHFGVPHRRSVASWIFDQTSGALGERLIDNVQGAVIPSDGTWEDSVRDVQIELNQSRLWCDPAVRGLLREANMYKYPTKEEQLKTGTMRPAKIAGFGWHGMDALCYGVARLVAGRAAGRVRVK